MHAARPRLAEVVRVGRRSGDGEEKRRDLRRRGGGRCENECAADEKEYAATHLGKESYL
jgi:hypothetical protein